MKIRNANYWKPLGNVFVGDCMPFYKDGVFHVYYLWDYDHHNHPVVGTYGGHQWAHISSTDLREWEVHPFALPLDFEAGECSNCTGCVFEWKGIVYAFYALRSRFYSGEQIRIAVSRDGGFSFPERFTPDLPTPPEAFGMFRDPCAYEGEDGLLHLLISSGLRTGTGEDALYRGEIAHYTTSDLRHFDRLPPLMRTLKVPECCDFFRMGDHWYHTYNQHWQTQIRMAETPSGPWRIPDQDTPASRFCAVMKTAPWKDGRRIGAGWVPTAVNGGHRFGGHLIFREIVQRTDGTLGTRFVPEMLSDAISAELPDAHLKSETEFSDVLLGPMPSAFRLEGRISFAPGTKEFGFHLRPRNDIYDGRTVFFKPEAHIAELNTFTIAEKLPLDPEGVPFRFVMNGTVMDLEINGDRTLVDSTPDAFSGTPLLAAFVSGGEAEFRDLRVYSL